MTEQPALSILWAEIDSALASIVADMVRQARAAGVEVREIAP